MGENPRLFQVDLTLMGENNKDLQVLTKHVPRNFLRGGADHAENFFYAARKLSTYTPLQGFFWLRGGHGPPPSVRAWY
jgi:hypothetical protein